MSISDEKIKKILEDHEKRLARLEQATSPTASTSREQPKNYKGLSGGINFLLHRKFFSQPRSLKEVKEELRRESYHYSDAPIAKALSVYFCKNKKLLTRVSEGKGWMYVLRK